MWVKQALLLAIRGYRVVSSALPPQCRYYPTCSGYALNALTTHGALRGTLLAGWRVLRCHPWSAGGYDPVPPTPQQRDLRSFRTRDTTETCEYHTQEST